MKNTRKLLSIILAILMIVSSVPFAFAADTTSGTFGVDNALTWTLVNGLLTISGNGAMSSNTNIPWAEYKDSITDVVIEEGVTDVANSAFNNYSNLKTAYIANSVKTIYDSAFSYCPSMEKVFIGSGVEKMTRYCFWNTNCTMHYNGTNAMWNAIKQDYNGKPWSTIHYLAVASKEPTCADNGYEDAYVCSSCDVIFGGTIIPATGEHTRVNEVCTVCGDGCTHPTWTNGACDTCGDPCVHPSYTESKCDVCKSDCKHLNYENGICSACSYECKHSWYYSKCTICGLTGGELNSNIIWTLDTNSGVFKLSGTGDMPEYSYYMSIPWFDLRGDIKTVIVSEGITSLSKSAFIMCANLTTVTLPDTINKIGGGAFSDCSSLEDIVIPSGVTNLDAGTFSWCSALKTIHYLGTENDLTIDETNNVLADGILHFCEEKTGVKQTCTEDGLADGWYCVECDKYAIGGEVLPASNHKDTLETVEAKAPTCTEIGWDAYEYCTACDYTTYVEKEALNHKDTLETVEAKAPTCTEIGWDAYEYCTVCDYTTYVEKEALNHKDTLETVEAKAPTCTEIGWDAYEYCTVCDYTTYVEKAALDHDIVIDAYVAPKCEETGLTAGQHCSRCDDMTIVQEVIPDLGGHINEDGNTTCDRCDEILLCEDCGRPVHDDTFVQKLICLIVMFINIVKSMFA